MLNHIITILGIVRVSQASQLLVLWQCARQQLAQHGDDAMVATAMKMDAMLEAGGHAGYATWAGIALRSAKLGPQVDAGETRH